tara:strand:- start:1471 stop:2079 length:609 start_codon:yes stop_codon:yes gene_type:complete
MSIKIQRDDLSIAVLSGGKSSRMNHEDKGLIKFNGFSVLSRIINLSYKYSDDVFVITNDNHEKYEKLHPYIYSDILDDYQGPLSGIFTALSKCKKRYVIILPCDGPFIREDYFEKFISYRENQDILVAKTGDRLQPVYARLRSSLKDNLKVFLETGERKIDKWYTACGYEEILFEQSDEMFININSKYDIENNRSLIDKLYG